MRDLSYRLVFRFFQNSLKIYEMIFLFKISFLVQVFVNFSLCYNQSYPNSKTPSALIVSDLSQRCPRLLKPQLHKKKFILSLFQLKAIWFSIRQTIEHKGHKKAYHQTRFISSSSSHTSSQISNKKKRITKERKIKTLKDQLLY